MIYNNGVVVREQTEDFINELNIKSLELSLFAMKNYHESLQEALENEIYMNQGVLQEAFSFKALCQRIWGAITSFFGKVKEIFKTGMALMHSILATSDQLVSTNFILFKEKIDKYGDKIKYKLIMPNPDISIMGECGADFSDDIYDAADDMVEKIKSSPDVNTLPDVQSEMNRLRGELLGSNNGLSQKEFNEALNSKMFLEEKEYTGIDDELAHQIIFILNSSPENISKSWDRKFEKKIKDLKNSVKKLDKNEEISSSLASYAMSYISGCLEIISCIHTTFIKANVKIVRNYRSLFMKVIKTLK